jgi:uncharacterized membrane protein YgaE (UPF0421/DUF939 family)
MTERTRGLITYTLKCATGVLLVFIIAQLTHYTDIGWGLISVLLVLSPDAKDAMPLAITRIKANVLGASIGVLCLLLAAPNMWTTALAVALTLPACYFFKLDNGIRSALAAAVIVMLHPEGKHLWDAALIRVLAVFVGCALALIITFVFHFKIRAHQESFTQNSEA